MKSRCEGPSLPALLPPPRTLVLWSSPSSPCPTARWRSGLTGDLLASGWGQWGAGGQEETPNAAGPPPRVGRVLQGQVRAVQHGAPCCSPSPSSLGAKGTSPRAKEPPRAPFHPIPHPPQQANDVLRKGNGDRQGAEQGTARGH